MELWNSGMMRSLKGLRPPIKSQVQSGTERNINKKVQLFRGPLAFSSTMEGVCSAQVQALNKHSRELKMGTALALQAAFADINIHKSRSVYYWLN